MKSDARALVLLLPGDELLQIESPRVITYFQIQPIHHRSETGQRITKERISPSLSGPKRILEKEILQKEQWRVRDSILQISHRLRCSSCCKCCDVYFVKSQDLTFRIVTPDLHPDHCCTNYIHLTKVDLNLL